MTKLEQTDRIAHVTLMVAVLAACVSPFALGAWKEADRAGTRAGGSVFASIDTNRDGQINRIEAHGVPGLETVFDQADADRNGVLTPAEFFKAQTLYARLPGAVEASGGSGAKVKVRGALSEEQFLPSLAFEVTKL